jgi:hypothetical protein
MLLGGCEHLWWLWAPSPFERSPNSYARHLVLGFRQLAHPSFFQHFALPLTSINVCEHLVALFIMNVLCLYMVVISLLNYATP